jgi:hypothetical protein
MAAVITLDDGFAIGETWSMPFTVEDADGAAINCTGATGTWVLQDYDTLAPVLSGTVAFSDAPAGVGAVTVTPATQTSASLSNSKAGTYRYRFSVTLSSGVVTDQAKGEIILTER